MRDKLIKLIREAFQPCEMYRAMLIADHLIANGVTVPVGEIDFDYNAEDVCE